jgi:hypothetical protein
MFSHCGLYKARASPFSAKFRTLLATRCSYFGGYYTEVQWFWQRVVHTVQVAGVQEIVDRGCGAYSFSDISFRDYIVFATTMSATMESFAGIWAPSNFTVEGFLYYYVVLKLNWRCVACECMTTRRVRWFSVWVQGSRMIVKVHRVCARRLVDSTLTCTDVVYHQRYRSTRLCIHSSCIEVKSHVLFSAFSLRTMEQEAPTKNFGGTHQVPLIPSKW